MLGDIILTLAIVGVLVPAFYGVAFLVRFVRNTINLCRDLREIRERLEQDDDPADWWKRPTAEQ